MDIARVRIRLAVERDPKYTHLTYRQLEELVKQLAEADAKRTKDREQEARRIIGVKKVGT